jgi:hypothetical protein
MGKRDRPLLIAAIARNPPELLQKVILAGRGKHLEKCHRVMTAHISQDNMSEILMMTGYAVLRFTMISQFLFHRFTPLSCRPAAIHLINGQCNLAPCLQVHSKINCLYPADMLSLFENRPQVYPRNL